MRAWQRRAHDAEASPIGASGTSHEHNPEESPPDRSRHPNIPANESRNAHAHLQALLVGNHVIVNVSKGELILGTYQNVILVELDGPRQQTVSLQWLSS
jgi:thiamine phosphate synthase YjbQ (UPF0047 family)